MRETQPVKVILLFGVSTDIELYNNPKGYSPEELVQRLVDHTLGFSMKQQGVSKTYWIDGEVFSREDVEKMPGHRTLLANMEGNRWDFVVKTRGGIFQELGPHDSVIHTAPVIKSS